MMRKTMLIAAVGAALAVGGTTAAVAASQTIPTATPTASATTTSASTTTPTVPSTTVDEAAARNIALGAVPGGTVTESQLVSLQGRSVWKVHVATATARLEVFVDATSGQIVATDQSGGGSTPTSATTPASPATSTSVDQDDEIQDGLDDGPGHDVGDDHGGRGGHHDG